MKTILHTCLGEVKGKATKFLIDAGSDACLITEKHADQLELEITESSNTLNIQTVSGELKPHQGRPQFPWRKR